MIKAILLLLLITPSFQETPQRVTADEYSRLSKALTTERIKQTEYESAVNARQAEVYRIFASHKLSPDEYELTPQGESFVFVKKQPEKKP